MRYLVVLVLVAACKGDSGASGGSAGGSAAPTVGSGGSGSAVAAGSGSAVAAGSASAATGTGSGSGSGSASPPPPLDPKVMAARCDEPCLFLLDTAVDKLGNAYKAACKKDMPDLGLTDCKKLDQIRKCVFAAHGFVFKAKTWKKTYEKKAWYVANPAFRPTQITLVEHANVVDLDARAKACRKGIMVSPADVNRVRTWLAGFDKGKPAWPKVIHKDGEPAKADVVAAFLHSELDSLNVKKIKLGSAGNTVSYEDTLPADLSGDLQIKSGAKLRAILVEKSVTNSTQEATVDEGVQIHMIYDDHDKLLAIDVSHFLWD